MKRRFLIALALLFSVLVCINARAEVIEQPFYQVSTIDALKQGYYHGYIAYQELKKKGDFGLGTLDGLDGEMVALDGEFYQIRTDGKAYRIPDTATTPFAVVVFFKPHARGSIPEVESLTKLEEAVERMIPCKEVAYAVKITGHFSRAHVRSVARQTEPYPDLGAALKHQVVFDLSDVQGTLVGFRFPQYLKDVNVAGYHFHFITDDKKAGGHVLDCQGKTLRVELTPAGALNMEMPQLCRPGAPERKISGESSLPRKSDTALEHP